MPLSKIARRSSVTEKSSAGVQPPARGSLARVSASAVGCSSAAFGSSLALMHLCFCPITKDGRLSAKDILGNRARMSEWQDDFYEYMHGFYPKLERGLPSAITHRKHIPPYLFRAMDNASKSYDAIICLQFSMRQS